MIRPGRHALLVSAAYVLLAAVGGVPSMADEREDGAAEYARRSAELAADDAVGRFQLGRWCEQRGMMEEARREYMRVLEIDRGHRRAQACLDALGGPIRPEGDGPRSEIPSSPGRYHVRGRTTATRDRAPLDYWLSIPPTARKGNPLPLIYVNCWRAYAAQGQVEEELGNWAGTGFEGFVAVHTNGTCEASARCAEGALEVIEDLDRVYSVDRRYVMVTDWRSCNIPAFVAYHPEVFRFAYGDSVLGRGYDWPDPPAGLNAQAREALGNVHVYIKGAGQDYKPSDLGFDDALMEEVRAYWETLGVRDVTLERYPRGTMLPEADYRCIDGRTDAVAARGVQWFQEKIVEDLHGSPAWREYERRRAALRDGDAAGLARLGRWCRQQGFLEEAREAYRKALEIDPANRVAQREWDALPPAR